MKKTMYICSLTVSILCSSALEAYWPKTKRLTLAAATGSIASILHQKFGQKKQTINKTRVTTTGITAGALTSIFSNTLAKRIPSPLFKNLSSVAIGIGASSLLSTHNTLPSWVPLAQTWNGLTQKNKSLLTASFSAAAALLVQAYSYYQEKAQEKIRQERIKKSEKILSSFPKWKKDVDAQNTKNITIEDFTDLLDATQAVYETEYQPYEEEVTKGAIAKKILLPENSQIAVHADIHGDAQALCNFIQDLETKNFVKNWKITKKDFYIILLGDYTDRGSQNIESFMSVLKLKATNPNNVILIRGNHESKDMNTLWSPSHCNFHESLKTEFKKNKAHLLMDSIDQFYQYLPDALFVGNKENPSAKTNWILFCHGGFNNKHNAKKFLQSKNTYDTFANDIYEGFDQLQYKRPNYQWTDFQVDANIYTCLSNSRGNIYSKATTEEYLTNNNLQAIVRGHQHSGDMYNKMVKNNGIARLWPDTTNKNNQNNLLSSHKVYTLNITRIRNKSLN